MTRRWDQHTAGGSLGRAAALCMATAAFLIAGAALAQTNWLTIAGIPGDASADYVQLDPTKLAKESGLVTIAVRVSRSRERTSQDGIRFRSFVGIAGVDCRQMTARFLRASFYREPNFEGPPFLTKEYGSVIRPVMFREIPGDHAKQTVRAACAAVK